MKGRFDTFTDAELYEIIAAFKIKGLNELSDEATCEMDRRRNMSSVDRKVYNTWRERYKKYWKKEEQKSESNGET